MAIDTNKPGEEEYQPAEYDAATFEATPTASSSTSSTLDTGSTNTAANIMEHLKRKNILIAVGIIIGIFCIYKIVDVLFSPSIPQRNKPAVVTQAQMPKSMQPAINPQPALANQVAASSVVDRLNTLEQQVNSQQTSLERLNSQITDLQNSVGNIDSKISTLSSTVQAVADIIAQQQAAAAAKKAAEKKAMHVTVPKPIYYVKALVPGRAWLATQDGGTITVSLGNNLPGYGRVEVIDPNQGTLITSTGAIIGYSPGDS